MAYQKLFNWRGKAELKPLCDLTTPPKDLYYRGKWGGEIFKDCVGVVGSRRMSDYGRRVIEKIVPGLVLAGKTVVSGLMYGVDQYAHKVTLESGGKTIAVLGWGIADPFSENDRRLAEKIVESGGLILSEWEKQRGTLWTFPARDRIIAALTKEVIVVEAAAQSGALITARMAAKLKRTVWAVPGPITSRTSVGTNNLIASGRAQMWLDDKGLQLAILSTGNPILDLLASDSLAVDDIARRLNKPVAEVGAQLTMLLMSGRVSERGGKYYLGDVG